MLHAIAGYISPSSSPIKSPQSIHVNMTPRGKGKVRDEKENSDETETIMQLRSELRMKNSKVSALSARISQLESSIEGTNSKPKIFTNVTHVIQNDEAKIYCSKLGTRGFVFL